MFEIQIDGLEAHLKEDEWMDITEMPMNMNSYIVRNLPSFTCVD